MKATSIRFLRDITPLNFVRYLRELPEGFRHDEFTLLNACVVAVGYVNQKPVECFYLLPHVLDGFVDPGIRDEHDGELVRADSVRIPLPTEGVPQLIRYELPHKSRDEYPMPSLQELAPIDPSKWIRDRQRAIDTAQQIKRRADKGQKQYGVAAGPAQLRWPFKHLAKIFRRLFYK